MIHNDNIVTYIFIRNLVLSPVLDNILSRWFVDYSYHSSTPNYQNNPDQFGNHPARFHKGWQENNT